ncbi:hypothetical protein V501_00362 [Pseudogymnoascus sp. VKM F-4519 (FW-2642)]|nr:hypothetical protein V501_00362 [Pseudogymnoascus sp. VKM F-4519 (FW-2642)]
MSTTKILITGATGYIGGAILSALLNSRDAKNYEISALVRKPEYVTTLSAKGVTGILFQSLDDLTTIKEAATNHDVVINAASASHDQSAIAIIEGLAERRKNTGVHTAIIHTSGTSILADRPISGEWIDTAIYSDLDDIYSYEKNHREIYSQRVVDLAVVETGEKLGVTTFIIVPPTIYGKGNGFFSTISQQVPNLTRLAIKKGQAFVLGKGEGIWNHVHILDLAPLYTLILHSFLTKSPIPSGKPGIYFAETGEHTWLEVSQGIAKAAVAHGLLKDQAIGSISLAEAAKETGIDERLIELALGSNSRARADLSRNIGWEPSRGNLEFYAHFEAEVGAVAKEYK